MNFLPRPGLSAPQPSITGGSCGFRRTWITKRSRRRS